MCVCVRACRSCQAVIMQLFNHQPTPLSFPSCCFPLFILSLLPFSLFGLYLYPFISAALIFLDQCSFLCICPPFCHICQASPSSSLFLTPSPLSVLSLTSTLFLSFVPSLEEILSLLSLLSTQPFNVHTKKNNGIFFLFAFFYFLGAIITTIYDPTFSFKYKSLPNS